MKSADVYIDDESDSSEELMQRAFDIEECEDSEAEEAIMYLKSVRM
jgi:hypothetical protein